MYSNTPVQAAKTALNAVKPSSEQNAGHIETALNRNTLAEHVVHRSTAQNKHITRTATDLKPVLVEDGAAGSALRRH